MIDVIDDELIRFFLSYRDVCSLLWLMCNTAGMLNVLWSFGRATGMSPYAASADEHRLL